MKGRSSLQPFHCRLEGVERDWDWIIPCPVGGWQRRPLRLWGSFCPLFPGCFRGRHAIKRGPRPHGPHGSARAIQQGLAAFLRPPQTLQNPSASCIAVTRNTCVEGMKFCRQVSKTAVAKAGATIFASLQGSTILFHTLDDILHPPSGAPDFSSHDAQSGTLLKATLEGVKERHSSGPQKALCHFSSMPLTWAFADSTPCIRQ